MPRALHIIETAEPGGAEAILVRLAGRTRANFDPLGLCMAEGWTSAALRRESIPVTVRPLRRSFDFGWARQLAAQIRQEDVDLIVCHEFSACVYGAVGAKLAGVPAILVMHGQKYWPDASYRRTAMRLAVRAAARTVCVSGDLRQLMLDRVGAPPEKLTVIYNGIPVERYQGKAEAGRRIRSELGIQEHEIVVVCVGALTEVKGHRYLLDAIRDLHALPLRLVVVGEGSLGEELRASARQQRLSNVHFVGQQSDVSAYLAAANVFCLPSLSEALPLALLEAMASGLPTVATRVGDVPNVMGEGGIAVPPGNAQALAGALEQLVGAPDLRARMSEYARARVAADFDEAIMVARYTSLFDEVLAPGSRIAQREVPGR